MDLENVHFVDNKDKKRFEMEFDGKFAFIDYMLVKDKIYLTHTEVPKSLEGKGIASKLVLQVLQHIQQEELKLVPLCPFVAAYIGRHPEWKSIVLNGINIA